MTFKDYQDWVKDHAPPGARSYRLHAEVSGQLFVFPAPPLPGLALSPPAMPLVASGQYLAELAAGLAVCLAVVAPTVARFTAVKSTR